MVEETDQFVLPARSSQPEIDYSDLQDNASNNPKELSGTSSPLHNAITEELMEKSLSILGHNHLGQIVFSCSTLKKVGLEDISLLSSYQFLQKIILDGNKLKSLDALKSLRYLVHLSASDNFLGDDCFESLRGSSFNLEHLELNNNQLRSLNGLHYLPYLINFSASQNQISELKSENFSTNQCLMRVNLQENQIANVEPQIFSGAQHIRSLNLSKNMLRDMTFTSYIIGNLESLFLSDNLIEHVCRSLSQCKSLVLLDLTNNRIETIEELQNICPAPGLRKLYVTGNPFREMIPPSIEKEKELSRLELTMTDQGYEGVECDSSLKISTRNHQRVPQQLSPGLAYAALTARHTFGRIKGISSAANIVNIPDCTNKAGELRNMALETQVRLRLLHFLPHLTQLNGELVSSEDVARSIAYFEEERPYFPVTNNCEKIGDLSEQGKGACEYSSIQTPPNISTPVSHTEDLGYAC